VTTLSNIPSDSKDAYICYTAKHIQHPDISIGDYTYGIPSIIIENIGKIRIGKFCSISNQVSLVINNEHRMDWVSTYPFAVLRSDWPEAARVDYAQATPARGDIVIGNDVWIGAHATILGGVTIGDGAVIGSHAMVAKDVAPYSIVVGNPIREIRKRFSDEVIAELLTIQWWNWPIEKIQRHALLLSSANMEDFLRAGLE
jgi:virginiamycin A acetyltransferase